ncbi:MAG TPA: serine/threonine-protein kinase, partial [Roseiflexaceae bacterium]|nr:serine/threonine-protein kinase [Roseiflexaceae bacterium]
MLGLMFLLIMLSVLLAVLLVPAWRGRALWRLAGTTSGENATALRFMAFNLCEPLVNTFVVLGLIWVVGNLSIRELPVALVTLPMAVLLLPILGVRALDRFVRNTNIMTLAFGVVRWVLNVLAFESINWDMGWLTFLAPACSIIVLIITYLWAGDRSVSLQMPLIQPHTQPSPVQPAAASMPTVYARPAETPAVVAAPLLSYENASPCPNCKELAWFQDAACRNCGLVFASRIPPALRNLPRYDVLRLLDTGGMSHIYLVRDRAGRRLHVLKTLASVDETADLQWRADAAACLQHEAVLLRDLRHAGIVELTGWYTASPGAYMVLEYIAGPTLDNLHCSAADVLCIGARVADAIAYLAALPRPIVHGDIKPANVIAALEADRVVLVDFGSAQEQGMRGPHSAACYGTPGYAAPEQYHGHASTASDMYGLAASLYQVLTGDDPSGHPLTFPQIATLPDALSAVLSQALAHEPQQRPQPAAFAAILRS